MKHASRWLLASLVLFTIMFGAALTSVQAAEEDSASNSITPPPISTPNIHDGVSEFKGAALYTESKSDTFTMTGAGVFMDYTSGFTERWGMNFVGALYGMGMEMDSMDMSLSGMMMSFGGNIIYEILQGEKKDAAGEVTKFGLGLSLYTGLTGNFMFMGGTGTSHQYVPGGTLMTTTITMSMNMMTTVLQGGVVAQIPLGHYFQLVPFGGFTVMSGTTNSDITVDTNYGDFSSSTSSSFSSSSPIYGMDIVLRPSRNSPNWKISLGTVISQVAANEDSGDTKNTTIMIGFIYEKGKNYSETMFGPVVR